MVAVADDHAGEVALPPVFEVEVVVVRVLVAGLPAVEGLVDHEHALAVASVEKRGRRRIMAGANGVVAVGLEDLDAALFGARDAGGAERAVVMMHAAAAQLVGLAIDAQAVRGVDFDLADADAERGGGRDFAVGFDEDLSAIEVRVGRGPEMRIGETDGAGCRGAAVGGDGDGLSGLRRPTAPDAVEQARADGGVARG